MPYRVTRQGQQFGPYSREELAAYVASGNVLASDLGMEEGVTGWVPVATLLGAGGFEPIAVEPAYAGGQRFESAPNLHWALLLLLIVVTFGSFLVVWYILLAIWSRKIEPQSDVPYWYYASTGLVLAQLATSVAAGRGSGAYIGITIVTAVVQIVTRFRMRTMLEQHYMMIEPVGLTLSGVMTFFFAEIYFQYHLNRINAMKRLGAYI